MDVQFGKKGIDVWNTKHNYRAVTVGIMVQQSVG